MIIFPLEILKILRRYSRTVVISLFTDEETGSEGERLCLNHRAGTPESLLMENQVLWDSPPKRVAAASPPEAGDTR